MGADAAWFAGGPAGRCSLASIEQCASTAAPVCSSSLGPDATICVPACLPACLPGCRATFDPDTIRSRLRELAFLNSRASIFFRALDGKKAPASSSNGSSSANGSSSSNGGGAPAAEAAAAGPVREGWETFHYSGGLAEYVRYLNRDKEPIHEPFYFSKTVSGGGGVAGGRSRDVLRGCCISGALGGTGAAVPLQLPAQPVLCFACCVIDGCMWICRVCVFSCACSRPTGTQWRWRSSGAGTHSGGLSPLSACPAASACLCLPAGPSGPTLSILNSHLPAVSPHLPSFLPAATRSSGLSTASRPLMAAPTSTVPRLRSRGWVRGGVGGLWLHACMKKAGAEAVEGSRVAESGYMSVYCCSCLPLPPCSEQRCAQGQAAEGGGVQPGWGVHPRGAGHGGVGQGGCVDVWVAGCVPVAWAW